MFFGNTIQCATKIVIFSNIQKRQRPERLKSLSQGCFLGGQVPSVLHCRHHKHTRHRFKYVEIAEALGDKGAGSLHVRNHNLKHIVMVSAYVITFRHLIHLCRFFVLCNLYTFVIDSINNLN